MPARYDWKKGTMGTLRTGRRYEIVFGPGVDQASFTEGGAIDSTFQQVSSRDPDAIILSAASDGLKVIGSEVRSAIDAGREACSIHCRVFDRGTNEEMSSDLELSRRPTAAAWESPIAEFDPRSAAPAARKSRSFKMPTRGPGPRR